MPRIAKHSLRVDLIPGGRIGPGKINLLEQIEACGSISAGARAIGMSYKRAWDLVEETGKILGKPVLVAKTGGKSGGGAALTPVGRALVTHYRAIEAATTPIVEAGFAQLEKEIEAAS
ncbi:LysR family transcriptional regulator [Mesorhizobium sp. NBSH29]|uniref:winged helix-turn-helix domain-containing protein n=1 Tax=Mesorhizobium sp. NBSH29 TaxID=2654249 RepID=UPI001896A36A|nr:winged helix-turn-helix domain-containing protein [Mesorhizobium sp. NBSH29]QPC86681.1 LysR family transcriptional regulator [Mesorhizobium sp. NBSH29]